ncbi:hypothetical protein MycrhDRAFT_3332 [Mycolicibacterium rhodesiae JS60]|nr:hypothetical protein MycrhDRAFT_3332 [Mycolicibacterium rhodesiae JS60]
MPLLHPESGRLSEDNACCGPATTDDDLTLPPEIEGSPTPEDSAQQVLITEQEILLGTAAVLTDPPSIDTDEGSAAGQSSRASGWLAALVRWLTPSWDEPRTREEDPLGRRYLEGSRMSREMDRL